MQENETIYVTPKAYRLLYNYCANSLLDGEGLVRNEKYRSLDMEGDVLSEGWQERRKELSDALAETGVPINVIHPIINSTPDFVAEHVHELLRKVRVGDPGAIQPNERIFVPDKTFRKMVEFISIRHFYYAVDDIAETGFAESVIENILPKSERKLRAIFEESDVDFDEFYEIFYDGDLLDDNRAYNIRKVLRKYFPESAREQLG